MEKPRGHVSHPDVLSLENRCLAMLPDLKTLERPWGHVSHPDVLSLENRCLATLPDLKTLEKSLGHVSHPDILSLENRCLAMLPGLKRTVSAGPLTHGLQTAGPLQADLRSLSIGDGVLSGPLSRGAERLSKGSGCLTSPRALRPISATASAPTAALGHRSSSEEKMPETEQVEVEMPFYNLSLGEETEVEGPVLKLSAGDSESHPEPADQALKDKKLVLMSLLCSTLTSKVDAEDAADGASGPLFEACRDLAPLEPEFILKASLYARQQLNLRTVANKVVAIAALLPVCRPYLRRYFCAIVQLPSDWLQVVALYEELAGREEDKPVPLPACLRAALTDKFAQFDEYQLAKYNLWKHRAKRRPRPPPHPPKTGRPFSETQKHLPSYLRVLTDEQKKFEDTYNAVPERKQRPRLTLKKLVRRLRIREPAQHVQALLGYRYPSDLQRFSRSRLPGPWDPSRAGKRMKLLRPETWEREVSLRGNRAPVWEELIDHGKLPFMALLRNLCNLLRVGVSARHHELTLQMLQQEKSVIHSRQFPFRFLNAHDAINNLEAQLKNKASPLPSNTKLMRLIMSRNAKQDKTWTYRRYPYNPSRRQLRNTMRVPVVYQQLKWEKLKLEKARRGRCAGELLARYRQALETAVNISVKHNLPPLPGRTLLAYLTDVGTDELCPKSNPQGPPLNYVLLLLGMVMARAEQVSVLLCGRGTVMVADARAEEGVLRTAGVLQAQAQAQELNKEGEWSVHTFGKYLLSLAAQRVPLDRVVLFGNTMYGSLVNEAKQLFWQHVNPKCLFVSVPLERTYNILPDSNPNDVTLSGYSDGILKFIAERGASRLLEHVGQMDKIFKIPPSPGKTGELSLRPLEESTLSPPAPISPPGWRSVRLFISSTFRDMHGERDLLLRAVLPALQAQAAPRRLGLRAIDLRWGIPEEETRRNRQLEVCLGEVESSQLFVGILGSRYGYVPADYNLPEHPHFRWAQQYPPGRSVTEMEVMQFLDRARRLQPSAQALIYLRDSSFLSSVPDAWKSDFTSESEEAARRITELKSFLSRQQGVTCRSYPCEWGGVAAGRPYAAGLEEFGQLVLQDVWSVIQKLYLQPGAQPEEPAPTPEDDSVQAAFQQLQTPPSPARPRLLQDTVQQLMLPRGGLSLVTGRSGQGKTAFLASLVSALQAPNGAQEAPGVFFHFSGARPDQGLALTLLRRLCAYLRRRLCEPGALPTSYRGLVWELQQRLLPASAQSPKAGRGLVLIVDGADRLAGPQGQQVSDWIPKTLPPWVHLVLSVSAEGGLAETLGQSPGARVVALGPLQPCARAQLVRDELALYGKRLEESPFNNQMRLLLVKQGSSLPLYLRLVTNHLRLYALHEQVSERLRALPATVPLLLQHILGTLEQEHGPDVLPQALATLEATRSGLTAEQLHAVLSAWRALPRGAEGWEEAVAAGSSGDAYPVGPFAYLVQSLRSLLGEGPLERAGARLCLPAGPLRTAAQCRYGKRWGLQKTAHVLIAAQLWKTCDPDASGSFRSCLPEALADLPHHLLQSGNHGLLAKFLTNLHVVAAHLELGLVSRLLEAHALYASSGPAEEQGLCETDPAVFHAFLRQQAPVLGRYPLLLPQQAANQPLDSPLCRQAPQLFVRWRLQRALRWLNKPCTVEGQPSPRLSLAIPSSPTAVALSPSGHRAAVGTADGMVYLLDLRTWQEEKSLVSGCDGVSSCVFLSASALFLTAFDGLLELWDLQQGCRVLQTSAHQSQITGCCLSPDRRLLATVCLGGCLKLWDTARGQLAFQHTCARPLNCAAFHPDGHVVAVGSWAGTCSFFSVDGLTAAKELGAPGASVRALAFRAPGRVVAAGRLDGTVELWSWREGARLATFPAHRGVVAAVLPLHAGCQLVTAGEDGEVQVWSGALGRPRGLLGPLPLSAALCVALSPDGDWVAVGYREDGVRTYEVASGSQGAHCGAVAAAVWALVWLSPRALVSGAEDGSLQGWALEARSLRLLWLLPGRQGPVWGLAASGELLASTSEALPVWLWPRQPLTLPLQEADFPRGAELREHQGPVSCCGFSTNGGRLATGGRDRNLFCWDVRKPQGPVVICSFLACHRDWVTGCAWTRDDLLVSCSSDGSVGLWDPERQQRLGLFLGHQSAVSAVAAVDAHVVSVGRDGSLKVWDHWGVELTSIPAHSGPISQCAAALEPRAAGQPGSELLVATVGLDGATRLWHPLLVSQTHTLLGHSGPISAAAVSEASGLLLTASEDGSVRLWQVPEEADDTCAPRSPAAITAVAWAPDGSVAASGSRTGELTLWHEAKAVATAQPSPEPSSAGGLRIPDSCGPGSGRRLPHLGRGAAAVTVHEARGCSLCDLGQLFRTPCAVVYPSGLRCVCPAVDGLGKPFCLRAQMQKFPELCMGCTHVAMSELQRQKESGEFEKRLEFTVKLESPQGTFVLVTQAKPESESSFLVAGADGMLWKLAKGTAAGEWATGNIWRKAEVPEAPSPGSAPSDGGGSSSSSSAGGWSPPTELTTQQCRKVHSGPVTALHVLPGLLVTASKDREVKLWERPSMQLLGLFRCEGAVSCLEPWLGPASTLRLAVGDTLGNMYFLAWE
ncbi:telomerase protein component 1 isoform X2 [Vulpes lagopus]|uniref:telomerase protein component 1 isoform X2 n=1 Tax=Vulpes lagopus TaxID=494514 RepID=UPI001BC9AD58|nr:telomerase protein component 1 isoform X2 [Vulpes lagopus]